MNQQRCTIGCSVTFNKPKSKTIVVANNRWVGSQRIHSDIFNPFLFTLFYGPINKLTQITIEIEYREIAHEFWRIQPPRNNSFTETILERKIYPTHLLLPSYFRTEMKADE
jgi:hypothetical protein